MIKIAIYRNLVLILELTLVEALNYWYSLFVKLLFYFEIDRIKFIYIKKKLNYTFACI